MSFIKYNNFLEAYVSPSYGHVSYLHMGTVLIMTTGAHILFDSQESTYMDRPSTLLYNVCTGFKPWGSKTPSVGNL